MATPGLSQMTAEQAAEYARVANLEEIAQRRDAVAARAAGIDGSASKGTRLALRNYANANGFAPLPADCRTAEHEVMLLAFTGPGYTRPCHPDPGIALLGAFSGATPEAATEAARHFAQATLAPAFGADIRAVPVDKWTLLASTPEAAADAAYCIARMDANMGRYYGVLQGNQAKFRERVEKSVKALEQQAAEAARQLADAREELAAAVREDTPARAAKLASLRAQLEGYKAREGAALLEECRLLGKRGKRARRAVAALEAKVTAAQADLEARRAADALAAGTTGDSGDSKDPDYPVPPEDAETLEERLAEARSYLAVAAAAVKRTTEDAAAKRAQHTETVDALQRQISHLASLDVARARAAVEVVEARHRDIRDRALFAAIRERVDPSARLPAKVREAKVEGDRVATLGLPVDKGRQAKVSARHAARRARVQDENSSRATLPPLPGHLLPRRQLYAAVCFLPDCDPAVAKGHAPGEPMVRVLKTYDDKAAAQADVAGSLSKHILDFHIDVVDMGEWLFPGAVDYDAIEEFQFRDTQQQEVMASRRRERKKVRNYETLCAQGEVPASELFLREAEEGISLEEYQRQTTMQGTVEVLK
jgi:hypothetical protein